jgi:ribonuclease P protein component
VKRRERLSGRRRFAAVRAERMSAGTAALRVHVSANGLPHARFGFAIPKALGGAVVRNTLRRRLRAALEPRRPELAGLDVVVSAFPPALRLHFAALQAELAHCIDAARRRMAENGPSRSGAARVLMPSSA